MTAHHGRNAQEDVYAPSAPPSHSITASAGKSSYSAHQTFALGFHHKQDPISSEDSTPAIGATSGGMAVFAFDEAQITSSENRSTVHPGGPVPTLAKSSRTSVAGGLRPRRLTPREVERCFGFPDDYTLIPGASDSARYEALGNSMAVPVMAWIGRRLLMAAAIVRANLGEQRTAVAA